MIWLRLSFENIHQALCLLNLFSPLGTIFVCNHLHVHQKKGCISLFIFSCINMVTDVGKTTVHNTTSTNEHNMYLKIALIDGAISHQFVQSFVQ